MVEYNPFKDFNPAFTVYKPVERKEVKIDFPLYDSPDVSDMFSYVSSSGKPVSSANTPKSEESQYDILSELGKGHYESNADETNNIVPQEGDDLAVNIMNKLISKGNLAPYQAAAIVGHLKAESRLKSSRINRNDLGKISGGLGQWRGDRFEKLKNFAKNRGETWNNLDTQVDYLLYELQNDEKDAYNRLLASTNPTEASKAWSYYERFAGYDGTTATAKKAGWSQDKINKEHKKREDFSNQLYNVWKKNNV